jgi:hypothetical protein
MRQRGGNQNSSRHCCQCGALRRPQQETHAWGAAEGPAHALFVSLPSSHAFGVQLVVVLSSCSQSPAMQSAASVSVATSLRSAAAAPRTATRTALGSSCRCAAQQPAARPAVAAALPRRALLAGGAAAAVAALAPVQPCAAFGSGFPGYDVNMDARKRAADRNRRENDAMMAKGEHSCVSGTAAREQWGARAAVRPIPIPGPAPCPDPPHPPTGSSTCSRAVSCKAGSRQGSGDGCGPIH